MVDRVQIGMFYIGLVLVLIDTTTWYMCFSKLKILIPVLMIIEQER